MIKCTVYLVRNQLLIHAHITVTKISWRGPKPEPENLLSDKNSRLSPDLIDVCGTHHKLDNFYMDEIVHLSQWNLVVVTL